MRGENLFFAEDLIKAVPQLFLNIDKGTLFLIGEQFKRGQLNAAHFASNPTACSPTGFCKRDFSAAAVPFGNRAGDEAALFLAVHHTGNSLFGKI